MPSLSEAYRSHPVFLQQHKHPDFTSLQELPDSYAWTSNTTSSSSSHIVVDGNNNDQNDVVPLIDLNDPNAPAFIARACKSWGVFHVINHGVSGEILGDIEHAGHALFSLPRNRKLRAARPPDGVSGYGVARISSFFPKLMWSEGFTVVGSPRDHFRRLWPRDFDKYW